ncbi:MAG: amidohydrolase, partial [Clostridia bacterium]|nr:amidohydrolase [Clostridia bacterium]
MQTLFRSVRLLAQCGYGCDPIDVRVSDAYITEIGNNLPAVPGETVIDGRGDLLVPGFVNTHCHAAMTLFRGYGEDLPLSRWLEEKIFPAEDRLTEESVYWGSMLAIAEMLRNGITSFSDMYFFCPQTARAVLESGIKANLSRSLVSFAPGIKLEEDSRFLESVELADEFHGAGDGRLLIDFSLHAEYTNRPDYCAAVGAKTVERGLRMQLHLSETESEHAACIARHGKTPAAFFADLGVFDAPTTAAHCVWVTDDDIAILRQKGVTVSHNPTSNLKLGSGVLPLRRLLDAGVNVALGTDGAASNNTLNILGELRLASILHKGVNRQADITTSAKMIALASRNGALAQGREDCGIIAPGMRADLALIDLSVPHNMPVYDLDATLTYSAEAQDVRLTMVDGRILYQDGTYTSIDIEHLRREAGR